MSRVNEAMRRASLAQRDDGNSAEPEAKAVERSILEGYVLDGAPRIHSTWHQGSPAAESSRAITLHRPVATNSRLDGKLVVGKEINRVSIEQYRRMAAVLQHLQSTRALKTLMVSSALPGEGKTVTVTNLALTLSESYRKRILLVDADLRRPSIQEVFRLTGRVGLCDDLRSTSDSISTVQVSPNLAVLPAGQTGSDPMAELSSERMRALIHAAAARFDWVLIDTPPVCLLPDAQLVALVSDAVLLVIAAKTTPYRFVERAIAELGSDRIIGTVLNRVNGSAFEGKGYYAGYYD